MVAGLGFPVEDDHDVPAGAIFNCSVPSDAQTVESFPALASLNGSKIIGQQLPAMHNVVGVVPS